VLAALGLASCDAAIGHPPARTRPPPLAGPLRVSRANPRYFADPAGRIVYLTGSHTWNNFQDGGEADPPPAFDYGQYLRSLSDNGQNFFRLWCWEQVRGSPDTPRPYWYSPMPYVRTGPAAALDGKPRFDLSRFNDEYFARMRARVEQARRMGIYVSIMLFDGWSIEEKRRDVMSPWVGHPFNRENNRNGIDGDPDGNGQGEETHTLRVPAITALQEAYVRKVIETVGDLDNVLYEISNESSTGSTAWQYHMVRYIKQVEATRAKQHPVGMTSEFPNGDNAVLVASPADWISPNSSGAPMADPPVADGRKVIVDDTDHLCGICGSTEWAWKSFLRGRNPLFMDVYDGGYMPLTEVDPGDRHPEALRRNLGYIRSYALRLELGRMLPHPELASSRYLLAYPDSARGEYLAYIPGGMRPSLKGRRISIDLRATPGPLAVEWFSPRFERTISRDSIQGGGIRELRAPFPIGDAVVYLRR
jgi:hypothetical protein